MLENNPTLPLPPVLYVVIWEVISDKLVSFMVVFQQCTVSHSNDAVIGLLILSCDSDDLEYFLGHLLLESFECLMQLSLDER